MSDQTTRETTPLFGSVNLGLSAAGLAVDGKDLPVGNDEHGYCLRLRGVVHDHRAPIGEGHIGVDLTIRGTLAELTALGDAIVGAVAELILSEYPPEPDHQEREAIEDVGMATGLFVDAADYEVPPALLAAVPGATFRPTAVETADYVVESPNDGDSPWLVDVGRVLNVEDGTIHVEVIAGSQITPESPTTFPFSYSTVEAELFGLTGWAICPEPEDAPPTIGELRRREAEGDADAAEMLDAYGEARP